MQTVIGPLYEFVAHHKGQALVVGENSNSGIRTGGMLKDEHQPGGIFTASGCPHNE